MKIFQISTILFLSFSSLCCGQNPDKTIFYYKPYTDITETNHYKDSIIEFDYNTQYQNILSANINNEVDNAIRNKDFRIIALSGNSYVFPGLSGGYEIKADGTKVFIGLGPSYKTHFEKFGFKVIEGTSDFINIDDLPLQTVSYDFAKEYNKLLFRKIDKLDDH